MPATLSCVSVPTDVIPEYDPLILFVLTIPDVKFDAFRLVILDPFPTKILEVVIPLTLSCESVPTDVMPEYEPETTELGTVPEAKFEAFKLVMLEPLPTKILDVVIPVTLSCVNEPTDVIPE